MFFNICNIRGAPRYFFIWNTFLSTQTNKYCEMAVNPNYGSSCTIFRRLHCIHLKYVSWLFISELNYNHINLWWYVLNINVFINHKHVNVDVGRLFVDILVTLHWIMNWGPTLSSQYWARLWLGAINNKPKPDAMFAKIYGVTRPQ